MRTCGHEFCGNDVNICLNIPPSISNRPRRHRAPLGTRIEGREKEVTVWRPLPDGGRGRPLEVGPRKSLCNSSVARDGGARDGHCIASGVARPTGALV